MLGKLSLIALLVMMIGGAGSASCDSNKVERAQNVNRQKNENTGDKESSSRNEGKGSENAEIKTLAEGQYGSLTNAFIAVARDAETYAALRKIVGNLPAMDAESFRSSVVVAAFLGQKRTGGYRVEIARGADGSISVSEKGPPAGSMTTQALATPFKIVSVRVQGERFQGEHSFQLVAGGAWKAMMRPYRVTLGSFGMSGGIAGIKENFQITGELQVMRQDTLATFFFDLKSADAKKQRAMTSVATGFVEAYGDITLAQVDAGTLIEMPHTPLRAKGKMAEGDNSLTLNFESLPGMVADGFSGSGSLQAEATAHAPKKNPANAEP